MYLRTFVEGTKVPSFVFIKYTFVLNIITKITNNESIKWGLWNMCPNVFQFFSRFTPLVPELPDARPVGQMCLRIVRGGR